MPANPSPVNLCRECGHECLPTPLGAAEHAAKHWYRIGPDDAAINAYRAYADELRKAWRAEQADHRDTKAELRDARDRIEYLEAELDHINRFGAMDS